MTRTPKFDQYFHHRLFRSWLFSQYPPCTFNTFLTLPLKQWVYTANGGVWPNSRENCEKLARFVRNRIGKAICGSRVGKRMLAVSFYEEKPRGEDRRMHIHMMLQRPAGVTLEEVDEVLREIVQLNEWLREDFDVLPITETPERVMSYCLKEGFDALLSRACVFPR